MKKFIDEIYYFITKNKLIVIIITILVVASAIYSFWPQKVTEENPEVEIKESNLINSPTIIDSPNTKVDIDSSITVNKPIPEIKIGTITDMNVVGMSPYNYSFTLRYSITMDTPSSYSVDYINLELYEVLKDETSEEIFLKSIKIEEPFDSWGMLRKVPDRIVKFSINERIENLKIKLVMGVEGGLVKEDSRIIWGFGGEQ